MSIGSSGQVEVASQETPMPSTRLARNYARPAVVPAVSLHQPARLRVAHLQALMSLSHTTVYERIKQGLIPPPDGWDMPNRPKGRQGRPYWNTSTIRRLLEENVQ